ncbi:YheC/YheD family protein [Paenibacillus sp. LHD-38]|uniref:YheC/YheD family endospore coat-associated protein n=1 Tax=Paenibacillus sp. LHD-38 TaxID=3072143 RepID=UPI00280F9DC3|nr:YheC/YheD family protein [Paenibacillus sp. LHD-38]MDQ8739191.1 YheC/YheD family protein [Paenibacillus sp. LHD-38]
MQAQMVILGIVVASITLDRESKPILPEPSFYRALSLAGKQLGIDVYVFAAEGFPMHSKQLFGYRWEQNRFTRQPVPLPDIVYDRCFFTDAGQRLGCRRMLSKLTQIKPHRLLNGTLPAKLTVYEALKGQSLLEKHLPHTLPFIAAKQLLRLAEQHSGGMILKPSSGMQGRGIVHVTRCLLERSTLVTGRSRQNNSFTIAFTEDQAFEKWITRFVKHSSYLIQPYLELSGEDNKPFDVRALIQKDEKSSWSISGVAVRTGQEGSLTSNLHGGGGAHAASQLLSAKIGKSKAERLLEQIHTISKQTAERLENKFGRLAELGLDYGIDKSGRLWLLEANSKPGRSSFQIIGDHEAERFSIERPLLYARTLTRRLSPSFVANEFANGRLHHSSTDNLLRPFNVQEVHR